MCKARVTQSQIMPRYGRGIFKQLPLFIMLGLIVLDALSVTSCLLTMTVTYTIEHAQKALHCALTVKKFCVSNAMKTVAMIETAVLSDRLQYHVHYVLSQCISIMSWLRLHFAILFALHNGFLHSGTI